MEYNQEEYSAIQPDFSDPRMNERALAQAQPEVIPTSDEPEAVPEPVVEPSEPQDIPVVTPEGDENELPDDPAKQREAWIKARQRIKELETAQVPVSQPEPIEEEPVDDSLLDELLTYQAPLPRPQSQLDLTDPYNAAVNEHIQAANQQAQVANQRAANMEARLEKMEAQSAYPQLKTDRYFQERVEEKLTLATLKAQQTGRPRPTMVKVAAQIAKELEGRTTTLRDTVTKEVRTEQSQALKQQTVGEGRISQANVDRTPDTSHLRARINKGDINALEQSLLEGELSGFTEKDLGFY